MKHGSNLSVNIWQISDIKVKTCANDYQFFKQETFLNWRIKNLNIF